MRKIGVKQMNRDFYEEIKNPPFIVTRNKEPYLLVMPYPKDIKNINESSLIFVDNNEMYMRKENTPTWIDPGVPSPKLSLIQKIKKLLNLSI